MLAAQAGGGAISPKKAPIDDWILSLDLPEEKAADVVKMLVNFGATKPTDLAGLDDVDVVALIDIIPKLKKANFKKQLEIYRPVLFFVDLFTLSTSQQDHGIE